MNPSPSGRWWGPRRKAWVDVGHRTKFVYECVDGACHQLPERVASLRCYKITRIEPFWQGLNLQIDLIFYEQR